MRLSTVTTISLLALAACSPQVPDSGAGVGFGDYDSYRTSGGVSTLPQASVVSAAPLDGGDSPQAIAAATAVALGAAPASAAPLSAMASDASTVVAAAPDGTTASPATISDEQSFAAVSERETIESDAARIAENRMQYVVIEPTDLPPRPDGTGASIVAYALATTNNPGQPLYSRTSLFAQARFDSACGKYGGDDHAQEAFLDAGGPERDRYGMDPDGDGFACYWDPRPFRAARAGAPEVVTEYEVVETPGEG